MNCRNVRHWIWCTIWHTNLFCRWAMIDETELADDMWDDHWCWLGINGWCSLERGTRLSWDTVMGCWGLPEVMRCAPSFLVTGLTKGWTCSMRSAVARVKLYSLFRTFQTFLALANHYQSHNAEYYLLLWFQQIGHSLEQKRQVQDWHLQHWSIYLQRPW